MTADLGIPAVAHVREFGTLGARVRAHLCANARLIAVSAALRDDLAAQGIPPEKIRVIYNGVSPPAAAGGPGIRAELGLPPDAPLVAWLGQITVRKAPEVFVAAAAEIARRDARAHFALCGDVFGEKEENLRLKAALAAAAASPPLAGRLHLLGWRTDARAILLQATVLAHTARQEPLGRVLIEALAAGTPVAATRVGGTPEVLGSCSALFEAGSPRRLRERNRGASRRRGAAGGARPRGPRALGRALPSGAHGRRDLRPLARGCGGSDKAKGVTHERRRCTGAR